MAQACWTLASPVVHHQLVERSGWSIEAYQQWLGLTRTATLNGY